MWEVKYRTLIKSCYLAASRHVKLWLQTCSLKNLISWLNSPNGLLEQYLADSIISLQRSNCSIFGLTDTVALFANEACFCQIYGGVPEIFSPKTSGWPPILFYISDITKSSYYSGKSLGKLWKTLAWTSLSLRRHVDLAFKISLHAGFFFRFSHLIFSFTEFFYQSP